MYYITDHAKAISEYLWTLRRPPCCRDAEDVCKALYGIVRHTDGRTAIDIGTDSAAIVCQSLTDKEVSDTLDTLGIAAAEKATKTEAITNARGNAAALIELLPANIIGAAHADLEADGWFPVEEL